MSLGFPGGSAGKESTCSAGDAGSVPGSGRSSGGGHGNSLQYSCLKNPMNRGAWQATVHGVAKNQTRLKPLNTHTIVMSPDRSYCFLQTFVFSSQPLTPSSGQLVARLVMLETRVATPSFLCLSCFFSISLYSYSLVFSS